MRTYELTLDLQGVDVLSPAFLDRLDAAGDPDWLVDDITLGRSGAGQFGIVALQAASYDAAVSAARDRLSALAPGIAVTAREGALAP